MGVYIKGMEMPKACVYRENGHLITCPLYDIDGYCGALNTEASHKENGKLSDCPLVPVPPHGRCIDANKLNSSETDYLGNHFVYLVDIDDAPTIIPAEEGE